MPFKFETSHLKIKPYHDKRIKLTNEDKEQIKKLYGRISQRKLASQFGVSRRLIIFIGCPEKLKRNLLQREERGGWEQYYNKDKHRISIKKHRVYKKGLYDKGVLE